MSEMKKGEIEATDSTEMRDASVTYKSVLSTTSISQIPTGITF